MSWKHKFFNDFLGVLRGTKYILYLNEKKIMWSQQKLHKSQGKTKENSYILGEIPIMLTKLRKKVSSETDLNNECIKVCLGKYLLLIIIKVVKELHYYSNSF